MTRLKEDVPGLDVAVDQIALVRVGEPAPDLAQDPRGLLERKCAVPIQPIAQRLSLEEGHDEVEEPVGFPGVVKAEDVWMVELRRDLDLTEKPLGAHRLTELGAEHLDRHRSSVLEVPRQVDDGHPTATELLLDLVASLQH